MTNSNLIKRRKTKNIVKIAPQQEIVISESKSEMKIILLMLHMIITSNCHLNLKSDPTNNASTKKCMIRIIDEYFQNCLRIIYVDFNVDTNYNINYPVITKVSNEHMKEFHYLKACGYLIQLNGNNLEEVLNQLRLDAMWNSRAKFLLLTDILADNVFMILSNYYIYNVAVVANREIYTFFPFAEENINDPVTTPVLIDACVNGSFEFGRDLYPEKLPEYWRNSSLEAAVMYLAPFTICLHDCEKKGVEFDILSFVMDFLKFNVNRNPKGFTGKYGFYLLNLW